MPRRELLSTFLLGALMSPFGWATPTPGSLILFVAAGCISVSALFCVNRSLKLAPASVVVPYQYSMIIWAVIFGLSAQQMLGNVIAGMVLLSARPFRVGERIRWHKNLWMR